MNRFDCLRSFAVFALTSLAVACGGSPTDSDQASVTTGAATLGAPSSGPDLAACNGRKECVRAAVLAIFFASDLQLANGAPQEFLGPNAPTRAAELVELYEGGDDKRHTRFEIITTPAAGGVTMVKFNVFPVTEAKDQSNVPEDSILFDLNTGLNLAFSIKDNKIVEKQIPLGLAG